MDNILFILTDQQRADSLGVVNGWSATPNLDALAGAGTLFTDCFTTSPVCVPARFSLASGLYPHNLGVQTNRIVTYPEWLDTWFGRLRRNGYRTSMFGKNHLHPDGGDLRASTRLLNRLGFDEVDEVGGPRALQTCTANLTDLWDRHGVRRAYRDDVAERLRDKPWIVRPSPVGLDLYYDTYVATSAARYLRHYDRPEPWCCYVGFPGPHEPWDTPDPWASAYDPAAMPPPRDAPRSLGERPTGDLDARLERRPPLTADEVAALRADYAGEVSLIDHLVGEVFEAVRDRGEWDRTVVVFTSDHGEMNGDAGLLYKKVFLDGAARVPLIIRDPASPPGTVEGPVELMDVGATVLDLAGLADHSAFRMARSLAPSVRGHGVSLPRTDALSEHDGEVMLATADWKIVLNATGETYLLFDRSADESGNLAGATEFADVQRSLEARLLQRLVQTSSRHPVFSAPPPASTVASVARRVFGTGARSWARVGRRGAPGAGSPAPIEEDGAEP